VHLPKCVEDDAMCTLTPGVCNTLNVYTLSLITLLHALLRCKQHQNLVPISHQPKCTFTFTISIIVHQPICTITMGYGLGTLHSPPPY
jgi:hypothetical protein